MLIIFLKKISLNWWKIVFYSKAIENLRKRINVKLVNNYENYKKKYVRKLSFGSQKIFGKNFVAIHGIKPVLTFDKSVYVGFSVLDFRK